MAPLQRIFTPRLGLIASVGVIALVVVPWGDMQGHTHWAKVAWMPFVSPPVRLFDVVGNVSLFVPFGAFHASAKPRASYKSTALIACALSVAGEALQLFSHQRFPSTTDVLCNACGAVAGAAAMPLWRRLAQRGT